jgi:hypothetical protein
MSCVLLLPLLLLLLWLTCSCLPMSLLCSGVLVSAL